MLFNKLSACIAIIGCVTLLQPSEAASTKSRNSLPGCASNNAKSDKIKESFLFAYNGYRKYAFGHDELLPISKSFSDSRNGWGASIVDALDTMLIMGLNEEYEEALKFVEQINFSTSKDTSKGFETNIRYLGGLLAANDLRPNRMLVQKAIEVTEATLIPLFVDSTSLGSRVKVPLAYMDLKNKRPERTNLINLAEFGTYTMEFTRLSQVTGNPKYEKLANDLINAAIEHNTRMPGLYPTTWTVKPFAPVETSTITIGGGGDSFYEYLIKNYMLQQDKNEDHMRIWESSVDSIEKYMLSPSRADPNIKFVAMIGNDTVYYSSQELICFWPGNILLGLSQMEDGARKNKFKSFADTFFKSCIETWEKTQTTIAPESWSWSPQNNELEKKLNELFENKLKPSKEVQKMEKSRSKSVMEKRYVRSFNVENAIYDLRPETIESVFYYYRMTGDSAYQDLAWRLFQGINKFARTEAGFARVDSVDKLPIQLQDFQESFFFAETLKYLYLTFTDTECISLNDYVFNTEAHPFKLPESINFQ